MHLIYWIRFQAQPLAFCSKKLDLVYTAQDWKTFKRMCDILRLAKERERDIPTTKKFINSLEMTKLHDCIHFPMLPNTPTFSALVKVLLLQRADLPSSSSREAFRPVERDMRQFALIRPKRRLAMDI